MEIKVTSSRRSAQINETLMDESLKWIYCSSMVIHEDEAQEF
jgi:hypothetical protein